VSLLSPGPPNGLDEGTERYLARPVRPMVQILVRVGLWTAVGLGCVGGVFALLRPSGGSAEPVVELPPDEESVPAPVAGVAELAVEAWLTATEDDAENLAALFVEPPELMEGDVEGLDVVRLTTVAGRRVGEGYWVVTVAAEVVETVADDEAAGTDEEGAPPEEPDEEEDVAGPRQTTWFVEVGIVGDAGGRLAALTTPGVLPASQAAPDGWGVALDAPDPVEDDDPLGLTIEAFLGALLAGRGEVSRYVAPGVNLFAADPPLFADLVVETMATREVSDGEWRVLVQALATTPGGVEQSVTYEVVAVARVDRWEISDFSGAPTADRDTDSGS
jgi:hypothetical protein